MFMLIDWFCVAVTPVIGILVLCKMSKNRSKKKTILIVLFTLYLSKMFDLVGVPGIQYCHWYPNINFIPFKDCEEAGFTFQVIANAVMFIPFGGMLPFIWKGFRKFSTTVIAGALTSICIEVVQLFAPRVTDIDDLLMNTLGTVIGYWMITFTIGKRWKNNCQNLQIDKKRNILELVIVIGCVIFSAVFIRYFIANAIYGLLMFP